MNLKRKDMTAANNTLEANFANHESLNAFYFFKGGMLEITRKQNVMADSCQIYFSFFSLLSQNVIILNFMFVTKGEFLQIDP